MTGLGEGHGVLHGLAVTDLAHQNHIWRLAQGVLQGGFPGVRVQAHFALRHHTIFMGMDKLNRVFNGDDVAVGVNVAPVHHGRQCRGLAGAGRANHDAQAAFGLHNFLEYLRHAQTINRG